MGFDRLVSWVDYKRVSDEHCTLGIGQQSHAISRTPLPPSDFTVFRRIARRRSSKPACSARGLWRILKAQLHQ